LPLLFQFEAWAKSNKPDASKNVMEWIDRLHEDFEAGRSDLANEKLAYNIHLVALSKQRHPTIAVEAKRVLKLLEETNRKFGGSSRYQPDVLTYTHTLHCIALSDAEDSFHMAYAILVRKED
jgi:hypothetical protein